MSSFKCHRVWSLTWRHTNLALSLRNIGTDDVSPQLTRVIKRADNRALKQNIRTVLYNYCATNCITYFTRFRNEIGVVVGVVLAADSQSTSASGYRAFLWDP
jgi:hypothetical protein